MAFRLEYTQRMRKWKWEEHQLKYLRLRCMPLRRPLGILRKQLPVFPDPFPRWHLSVRIQSCSGWYSGISEVAHRVIYRLRLPAVDLQVALRWTVNNQEEGYIYVSGVMRVGRRTRWSPVDRMLRFHRCVGSPQSCSVSLHGHSTARERATFR